MFTTVTCRSGIAQDCRSRGQGSIPTREILITHISLPLSLKITSHNHNLMLISEVMYCLIGEDGQDKVVLEKKKCNSSLEQLYAFSDILVNQL